MEPAQDERSSSPKEKIMIRPQNDPKFARESGTWRRMKPWQIVLLLVVAIAVLVLGLFWV
jgi:type VI protein secretion system component VasF